MKIIIVAVTLLTWSGLIHAKDIPRMTTPDSRYLYEDGTRWFQRPDFSDAYLDSIANGYLIKLGRDWFNNTNTTVGPAAVGKTYSHNGKTFYVDQPYSGRTSCGRCHVDGGMRPNSFPLYNAAIRYGFKKNGDTGSWHNPTSYYRDAVERWRDCSTNCAATGTTLPLTEPDPEDPSQQRPNLMADAIEAYLLYIQSGIVDVAIINGSKLAPGSRTFQTPAVVYNGKDYGVGVMPWDVPSDPVRGAELYEDHCDSCHGDQGEGKWDEGEQMYRYPPLTGLDSFTVNGGMYRVPAMGRMIMKKLEMPFDKEEELPWDEAIDIAGFVNSLPNRIAKPNHRTAFGGVHPTTGAPTAFHRKATDALIVGYFPVGYDEAFTYNEIKYGKAGSGWMEQKQWLADALAACIATGPDVTAVECETKRLAEEDIPSYVTVKEWQ